jgi:hypothetical protein
MTMMMMLQLPCFFVEGRIVACSPFVAPTTAFLASFERSLTRPKSDYRHAVICQSISQQ